MTHRLQPLLVVVDQLTYPTVEVVEDGSVPREHEVCAEGAHSLQRLQVTGERMRFGFGPEPDVRGDLQQHMVRGEEDAARFVVEHDLVVRVPRNVDDTHCSLSHRQLLTGTDRNEFFRQWQRVT